MALKELLEELSSFDKTTVATVALVGLITYRIYHHYSTYVRTKVIFKLYELILIKILI